MTIVHRKIQKSSCSDSGSDFGSGSGSRMRGRPPRTPKDRGKGHSSSRSSLASVIDPSPCSTFSYTDAFPCFSYPFIGNWIQWRDGHAPPEHWLDTPDSLYVIANAFNLCVILIAWLGSMTVLPLYSYSDQITVTLVIEHLAEQHSWAKAHSDKIADWNKRFDEAYPPSDPFHVYL
ncbi:hypothetical protein M9H77_22373 [Catharanthus roseus]|uniref:Uncharacterized protein n=1 Tax=Catharanthus roseus TaxID=4058 RepID=A0ACC0AS17_CATRO|nr:hypothetical protein M9H77_22373 [Catharanthus roseus]